MKLQLKTNYDRLLWTMRNVARFSEAIDKVEYSRPLYEHEGIAGCIEVDVTFYIKDLERFTQLWNDWLNQDENVRFNQTIRVSCRKT